jgi:hypothetical protein
MRRSNAPDVLEVWGLTWTKRGDVWEGPLTSDLTPFLPLALELGRIEVRGDRYVMVDPGLTLDRFVWTDDDLTIFWPEGAEEEGSSPCSGPGMHQKEEECA